MTRLDFPSDLTANNFLIETVDLSSRTTLSTTATSTSAGTITDSTPGANFATVDTVGFQPDDIIRISYLDPVNSNNGTARVVSAAGNTLTIADHSGTFTTQAAGDTVNITRIRKTFELVPGQDNLILEDGVRLIAITSRLQQLFDTGGLERFDPPFSEVIFDAQSITFINGWEPKNEITLNCIRQGTISINDGVTGALSREYMNVNSGGLAQNAHRPWFWFDDGAGTRTAAFDSVTAGYMDQLILIQDVANGIDRRSDQLFIKSAEPGYTIFYGDLGDELGVFEWKPQSYRTSLNNRVDLKLASADGTPLVSDTIIRTTEPYQSVTYATQSPSVQRTIEGVVRNFNALFTRTGATKEQAHAALHLLARDRGVNIDDGAGTLLGEYAPPLSSFLGEEITFQGYADGTPANENNDTVHIDDTGAARRTAREASFTIDFQFQTFLPAGQSATYWVYLQQNFNQDDAAIVQDKDGANMTGTVNATGTVAFSISYSTFNQQGHTPNTEIPIVIVVASPGNIQHFAQTFTIEDNTTQRFTVRPLQTLAYVTR